jgi:hypothetical protein
MVTISIGGHLVIIENPTGSTPKDVHLLLHLDIRR